MGFLGKRYENGRIKSDSAMGKPVSALTHLDWRTEREKMLYPFFLRQEGGGFTIWKGKERLDYFRMNQEAAAIDCCEMNKVHGEEVKKARGIK